MAIAVTLPPPSTPEATSAGAKTSELLNGPAALVGTTQPPASNDSTLRLISEWKPPLTPERISAIANTRLVARMAMMNRRRRNCRSRHPM